MVPVLSPRQCGNTLLVGLVLALSYYSAWILGTPFYEDTEASRFFPSRALGVFAPVFALALLVAVLAVAHLLLVTGLWRPRPLLS